MKNSLVPSAVAAECGNAVRRTDDEQIILLKLDGCPQFYVWLVLFVVSGVEMWRVLRESEVDAVRG